MDSDFIEIIFVIGAIVLTVVFFKYFLIALGIIAVAIAAVAIVKNYKNKKRRDELVLDDVSRGSVEDYIKKSTSKIQNLRRYYYKLKDEDARVALDKITQSMKKILGILKEDPRDFKAIRRFMNITLDSSEKILNQSAQLYTIESPSEKTKEALDDAKEGLELISTAVGNQISKLYDNNAMDLDIEVRVLKKVLGAKGLLNDLDKENEDDQGNN